MQPYQAIDEPLAILMYRLRGVAKATIIERDSGKAHEIKGRHIVAVARGPKESRDRHDDHHGQQAKMDNASDATIPERRVCQVGWRWIEEAPNDARGRQSEN